MTLTVFFVNHAGMFRLSLCLASLARHGRTSVGFHRRGNLPATGFVRFGALTTLLGDET
jgi:hypothetical protein